MQVDSCVLTNSENGPKIIDNFYFGWNNLSLTLNVADNGKMLALNLAQHKDDKELLLETASGAPVSALQCEGLPCRFSNCGVYEIPDTQFSELPVVFPEGNEVTMDMKSVFFNLKLMMVSNGMLSHVCVNTTTTRIYIARVACHNDTSSNPSFEGKFVLKPAMFSHKELIKHGSNQYVLLRLLANNRYTSSAFETTYEIGNRVLYETDIFTRITHSKYDGTYKVILGVTIAASVALLTLDLYLANMYKSEKKKMDCQWAMWITFEEQNKDKGNYFNSRRVQQHFGKEEGEYETKEGEYETKEGEYETKEGEYETNDGGYETRIIAYETNESGYERTDRE